MAPTPNPTTVELWIRSFAPASTGPTQERAIERVDALERRSEIETTVRVWGAEIERDATARSRVSIPQLERIDDRLEAFEAWADETGQRLAPFFRERTVESVITGAHREVWRLPTVALAEFRDGDLVHVAPCSGSRGTVDVFDRLDALDTLEARGEESDPDGERTETADEPVLRYDDRQQAATEIDGPISERPAERPESDERRLEPSSSSGPR
ncbi:HTH domain-containing protein [Halobiforma nitratireducens]|uniref:Uncharacterized protein n=1 Tax=Halobiforma nitratireducens JCM 10879 TaxID=1227454 RepID=M0LPE4_9EURY|nr:HTH domain-containing protein [Halobiforma nitratireducens]EMA35417.1 hypothetical protein C446_12509 [Halobiforma nitratireducens JCM 10879]